MFNLVYSNTNVILVQVVASPFLTSKVRLERALHKFYHIYQTTS